MYSKNLPILISKTQEPQKTQIQELYMKMKEDNQIEQVRPNTIQSILGFFGMHEVDIPNDGNGGTRSILTILGNGAAVSEEQIADLKRKASEIAAENGYENAAKLAENAVKISVEELKWFAAVVKKYVICIIEIEGVVHIGLMAPKTSFALLYISVGEPAIVEYQSVMDALITHQAVLLQNTDPKTMGDILKLAYHDPVILTLKDAHYSAVM